ncbi:hypothetical protein R3P38DRAFT_3209693 [Favolaschia claudopus]|uniref:Uncharacterized protein n=1 Tax=Favolaschia claudopus TaxID=2862362 RepID=A0AAW0AHC2_9AGAR
MPRQTRRQTGVGQAREHRHSGQNADDGSDDDVEMVDGSQPGGSGTGKRTTMRAQLTEKEAQIADLEATVLDLRSTLCQLQEDFNRLRWDHTTLENDLELTSAANKSLKSLKRKADAAFLEETRKQQKRYKRLQTTRDKTAESTGDTISTLNETIDGQFLEITNLSSELAAAREKILARDEEIIQLRSHLKDRQSTITALRNRLYASQKQNSRAQVSIKELRKRLQVLLVWNPRENGQYT